MAHAHVGVETISEIEPLEGGDEFASELTVPGALRDVLFAQPALSTDELALGRIHPETAPELKCYVLIDAAKITNAAQLIEASDLPCRCLFTGGAFEELSDVAPWLVELKEGNSFTRQLFLVGDEPWCLWGLAPLIYFRSRESLQDIWHHLRKFTNVKLQNGSSVFLRFWDTIAFRALILSGGDASDAFLSSKRVFIHDMGLCDASEGLTVFTPIDRPKNGGTVKMDDKLEKMLFVEQHSLGHRQVNVAGAKISR